MKLIVFHLIIGLSACIASGCSIKYYRYKSDVKKLYASEISQAEFDKRHYKYYSSVKLHTSKIIPEKLYERINLVGKSAITSFTFFDNNTFIKRYYSVTRIDSKNQIQVSGYFKIDSLSNKIKFELITPDGGSFGIANIYSEARIISKTEFLINHGSSVDTFRCKTE